MQDTWSRWSHAGVFCQGRGLCGGRQVEGWRLALLPGVSCSPPPAPCHLVLMPQETPGAHKEAGSPTLPGDAGLSEGDSFTDRSGGVGCTERPNLTACPCKNQGWGQGSKAVYKALKLFMVPGGTLAIQRDTCQIVLAGSAQAGSTMLSLGLPASLYRPAFTCAVPPPTALSFLSQPSQLDGRPCRTAPKPPPPGSSPLASAKPYHPVYP